MILLKEPLFLFTVLYESRCINEKEDTLACNVKVLQVFCSGANVATYKTISKGASVVRKGEYETFT